MIVVWLFFERRAKRMQAPSRKTLLKIQARCDKTFKRDARTPQHCPQAKQMQAPTRKALLSAQVPCDEAFGIQTANATTLSLAYFMQA